MFALDVSRSMLADDVSPNRLERAKQQIKDMVDEMSGDRVGLIVFAGDAKQEVPLTRHYHDFKKTLDEVGPYNVQLGGSSLGNAIKTAADSFLTKTGDHKAIVVFTDGEDQESKPVQVAKQAYADQGIRVFTVGWATWKKDHGFQWGSLPREVAFWNTMASRFGRSSMEKHSSKSPQSATELTFLQGRSKSIWPTFTTDTSLTWNRWSLKPRRSNHIPRDFNSSLVQLWHCCC